MGRDQDNSWLDFQGMNAAGLPIYSRQLMNQYGGYLQGQYWFSNQWFVNLSWGLIRDYGIDDSQSGSLGRLSGCEPSRAISTPPMATTKSNCGRNLT